MPDENDVNGGKEETEDEVTETTPDKTSQEKGDEMQTEELDYEPANTTEQEPEKKEKEPKNVDMEEDEEDDDDMEDGFEIEGALTRLRCLQCEFLKFKNVDQWKNHCIGHWRLDGMKKQKMRCFVLGCKYRARELGKLGGHFIDVHGFKQAAYRKCDICNLDFMEERKYNVHMRKHDPSFTCDLCKKKITGKFWYRKHIETCYGDDRPSWAKKQVEVKPGEDKEVLEIYGKEYDVHWGTVTNTFTQETRIVARAWIEGKAWTGKADNRDEARNKLIKSLKGHIKKAMDKGLYTLEDGELVPEPVLSETPAPPTKPAPPAGKVSCPDCGTQFAKRANLELHMFMHRGEKKKST